MDDILQKPDWEGFGRAIMEEWDAHYDIEASEKFDLARKFNILREIPGGFDPESHSSEYCDAEKGDMWFELNDAKSAPETPAPVSPQEAAISGGIEAIAAERQRQIEIEGWTPEHDDMHNVGEMLGAAVCYVLSARGWLNSSDKARFWPWDQSWWKPKTPREDLVRAGALIAAEIDRLDRLAEQEQE